MKPSTRERRDVRLLRIYALTIPTLLRYAPDAEWAKLTPAPEALLARLDLELAQEASRYRALLGAMIAVLLMPGALAAFLWSGLYWLPVRVPWYPFFRGEYGLPFLSLFEWLAFLLLGIFLIYGWALLRTSRQRTGRMAADLGVLRAADAADQRMFAHEVISGHYPRVEVVLRKASPLASYSALLSEAAPETEGAHGTELGLPAEADSSEHSSAVPCWSVWSAVAVVALTVALTLLAGLLVSAIGRAGWPTAPHALAVGAVLVGVYAAMLGVAWAASACSRVRFWSATGIVRSPGPGWYVMAAVGALGAWLFSVGFTTALMALGVEVPRDDLALFRLVPRGTLGVAIMVVVLVLVAPLAEEIVYRGVLLSALEHRWGTAAGVILSALVFSAVHVNAVGLVPLFVVGSLLGWLFVRSRSLRVAIAAHALFNALGVAMLLAQRSSGIL